MRGVRCSEVNSTNHARDYFQKHVTPSYHDWKSSQNSERLAMNLANNLNNLAEYYWHTFSKIAPDKIYNKKKLKEFRNVLAQDNMSIALIRDIADAHKHLKLCRPRRNLTSAHQTSTRDIGYGQAYGLVYGGGEVLVVSMDNGNEKYFPIVAEEAYEYWTNKIQESH